MFNLTPVEFSSVQTGKFYFRTPDCTVLFIVESREKDKLSVLVGRILNGREKDVDNFDLKKINQDDKLYEINNFPLVDDFKNKLKDSGYYYEKAVTLSDSDPDSDVKCSHLDRHVESIVRSLDYASVGRKALTINNNNERKTYPNILTKLIRGQFEFPKSEIERDRPEYGSPFLNSMVSKVVDDYVGKEEKFIFDSVKLQCNTISTYSTSFNLKQVFKRFASSRGIPSTMIGNPSDLLDICFFDEVDMSTTRERKTNSLYGHLWTADMFGSTSIKPGEILLLDDREKVGELIIQEPFSVKLTPQNENIIYEYESRIVIKVYQDCGFCIDLHDTESERHG